MAHSAASATLPVHLKDRVAHVTAADLERQAGIAIKRLPERGGFVACGSEACAPLEGVLAEGDALLVPVAGLAEALNLEAKFDDNRRQVALTPSRREASRATGLARVGSLAPKLRLTKIDGTTVTLDEFRGQRVLINSWGSW
ncbi:MAG: hypothetical protein ACKV19_04875 [Verrucomicrobiales bacterium]